MKRFGLGVLIFFCAITAQASECRDILFHTADLTHPRTIEGESFLIGSYQHGPFRTAIKTPEGFTIRLSRAKTFDDFSLVAEFELPLVGRMYFNIPSGSINLAQAANKYRFEFSDLGVEPSVPDEKISPKLKQLLKPETITVSLKIYDMSSARSTHFYKLRFFSVNEQSTEPPTKMDILFKGYSGPITTAKR